MGSAHRSALVLAGTMLVTALAGCVSDDPTRPTAAESAAFARSHSFATLTPAGSIGSQAWGIDPPGKVIVGANRTADGAVHGWMFTKGAFTTIDYPGAVASLAAGINGRGDVTGWYMDADGAHHGFIRQNGVFATVDVPGAVTTRIHGIIESGDIVGSYDTPDGRTLGFVRSHGRFSDIEPFAGASFSEAKGISPSGEVVGYYVIQNENGDWIEWHGFLLRGGKYTIIDFPGSTGTGLSAINAKGEMLGWYDDADGTHSFLLRDGRFSSFDVPGPMPTRGNAMNDRGDIVGWYYDPTEDTDHGFVLRR